MKKTLSLLLASLMLASALVACAGDSDDTPAESGETSAADTTAVEETTAAPLTPEESRKATKDSLPADLDFGGLKIGILTRNASTIRPYDVDGGGEESGDIVKDSVYRRNRTVEERLKVKLEVTASGETWQNVGKIMEASILAGDDEWQLHFAQGNYSYSSKRDYLFIDLSDSKYIDFDQPWWWNDAMHELSIDGKTIRYMVGDIVLNNYTRTGTMYFNKQLYQNAIGNPDDLYQLVLDRKWTYDKLTEYAAASYSDLNGDGQVNTGDRYGLYVGYVQWLHFFEGSADYQRYTRHADGYPIVDFDLDRAQTHLETLNKLLWETKGVFFTEGKEADNRVLFAGGSSVFYAGRLHDTLTAEFRDMQDSYGIIPYPMMNEGQKEYSMIIDNSGNYVCIPITCKVSEQVGAVIEALGAESYRTVILPFYETALKTKYSHDQLSGQCIDIIINTANISFTYTYSSPIGGTQYLYGLLRKNSNELASTYAANIEKVNKNIADLVASYKKQAEANK